MLNYYQTTAKSHLLSGLSATALSPTAAFGSSPKHIHTAPQAFAVTGTCHSLATRTDTWPWRSCALLPSCLGSMLLQREDTKGGHIPPKPNLCFSCFTEQWQCLSALCCSKKLPKTQGKTGGNAKMHHNRPRGFHKGLLTSSK